MNGPNENASSARSLGVISAASSTYCQASIHQCQSSAVSSTTSGRPRVPEVWWQRTYRSIGNVRLAAKGSSPGGRLKFFLGRQRQRRQLIEAFEPRRATGQLVLVERVVRQDVGQQAIELFQLQRCERRRDRAA